MNYSKKALEYFHQPRFAGEMKHADALGQAGNLKCGDIMRIYLKIKGNIIKKISFLTYGCVAAIASSNALCSLAQGKTIHQALKITHQDIVKELGGLPPMKIHCSVLGREALHKAIENYKKNIKNKEIVK